MKKKLFLVINVDWFFLSHRLPIALEALERGYDVTVFAIDTGKGPEIESYGLKFVPIPTSRAGTNILQELNVIRFLYKKYKAGKPDVVHHVAMKPVTYGSIAAKFLKIPVVVNALSGMGTVFSDLDKVSMTRKVLMNVFKYAFNNPSLRFIFQNPDDLELVNQSGIIKKEQCYLIKGSGVDLNEFQYQPPVAKRKIRFLLPARMLWDKGVGEFVEAARLLHPHHKDRVEFILAGKMDPENKTGIPQETLEEWNTEGCVQWVGFQTNMKEVFRQTDVAVLPSYREGLPKALIEAFAIGRPAITTNVPGCKHVVDHEYNGLLIKNKSVPELAQAMERLLLDEALREQMGHNARQKAEQEFSLRSVIDKTFDIYEGIAQPLVNEVIQSNSQPSVVMD